MPDRGRREDLMNSLGFRTMELQERLLPKHGDPRLADPGRAVQRAVIRACEVLGVEVEGQREEILGMVAAWLLYQGDDDEWFNRTGTGKPKAPVRKKEPA